MYRKYIISLQTNFPSRDTILLIHYHTSELLTCQYLYPAAALGQVAEELRPVCLLLDPLLVEQQVLVRGRHQPEYLVASAPHNPVNRKIITRSYRSTINVIGSAGDPVQEDSYVFWASRIRIRIC